MKNSTIFQQNNAYFLKSIASEEKGESECVGIDLAKLSLTACTHLSYFASSMLRCTITIVPILLCVFAEKCRNSQNLSQFEKYQDRNYL